MTPEDIRKLLGGYATDTLTAEERQALFAAALEDQELFDALGREQSLRDLLRDPAARAELLSALDAPSRGPVGFWQWLHRPTMVGLAAVGVAAVAVVAVWQGTRTDLGRRPVKGSIVAEVQRQEAPLMPQVAPQVAPEVALQEPANGPESRKRAVGAVPATAQSPASKVMAGAQSTDAGSAAGLLKEKQVVDAIAEPSRVRAEEAARFKLPASPAAEMADKKVALDAPAAAPVPAPVTIFAARKAEADTAVPPLRQFGGVVGGIVPRDARTLFYADQSLPAANVFVAPSGALGTAQPKDAPPPAAKGVVAGLVTPMRNPVGHLGVRVTILRGEGELDLATVLDPGEPVRLKLIPNADGFLYVTEGTRLLASGAAHRLKPFETPALRFDGSGPKQLRVTLSRHPRTPASLSLGAPEGDRNLVQTSPDKERATYVVSVPDAGVLQLVVPVTLTYR